MAKQAKKTEKVKETNKSTNQQTSTNTAFSKKSPIQRWIDDYKTTFKQYQEHCRANNWVFSENLEQLYDIEKLFINIALDRAKQFTKKFESYLRYQYVQDFLELLLEPVRLYMERYHLYLRSNMLINIQDPDRKLREMEFQAKLTADYNKFSDRYYDLNINREEQHSELPIHGDKKIPFLMAKTMEDMFPYIKDIKTSLNKVEEATTEDLATHTVYDVMNSTELFRNIKNPPPYDLTKHYYEQSKDTLDFYEEELKKIKQGVTIAGVFIHPLLYWHINYFKTDMPMNMFKGTPFYDPNESILIGHPFLRDNELFFVDSYQRAQEQNLSLFMFGSRRIGKALWVGEKVYKAKGGTKNIGDVKVGDRIIGGDGKPTNVVGVYPQGSLKLFRVKFSDGRSVLCCDEHLWTVFDYQAKEWKTLPLKEIKKRYRFKRTMKIDGSERTVLNYYIPVSKSLNFDVNLKPFIDPYLLGLWLGDGNSSQTRITTVDEEIVDYLKKYAEDNGYKIKRYEDITYSLTRNRDNYFLKCLQKYNLIGNKHIPEECFLWSEKDRLSLLQGLMDTDGTINKSGGDISFVSANSLLFENVHRLCLELGIHCHIEVGRVGSYLKKDGNHNTFNKISLFTDKEIFRLKRKLSRMDLKPRKSRFNRYSRVGIEEISEERVDEAICIRVDNEDSLFLTTNCVVTHNTTLEASLLSWRSTIVRNGEGYVVGGSERDLKKLSKTIMIAMNNIHPAFRLQNNRQDWDSHVQLGLKKKDNTVIDYNNLYISNVNSGSKADSLKTAGGSPSVFAVDEIGKFDCKLMYQQALPSFDTPEGRRCPVVLTGTGGEEEMSRDAQDMLLNPASYAILPMDWELLENYVGEERLVTWKRRSFGIFVPGQMSYKSGLKKKVTTLADYKKVESESLKKLELHLTDWANAKEVMEKDRENKKNDKDALAQEKMSYPFDPMESFVNRIENPFCAKEGQEHLEHLREEGLTGKKVEITRLDGTKRLKTFFSDKELAPFPFKGGNIDAPIVIFEEPPENPKFDFTYAAGLDPYKHDKANTDSIGVLYIFKRAVNIKDPFADRVVAVYAARPDRIDTFNETCEMLLEGYGAQCLMENADISFQIYLRRKGKDGILLANGEELVQSQINPRAVQNNKVGMNTSIVNQRYIFNITQNYANEWITVGHTEDGDAIEKRGIVRIPDEGLLQEMIGYYPGMNADRLVAFGHALALARYWDSLNLVPRREVPMDKDMFKEQKLLRQQFASPYSSGIISPYSQTFSPYGGF